MSYNSKKKGKPAASVVTPPQPQKVSRETMLDLGFTETWPSGNPKEPWWEKPFELKSGQFTLWFTELPTVEAFWNSVARSFGDLGRREVRALLKKAIEGTTTSHE